MFVRSFVRSFVAFSTETTPSGGIVVASYDVAAKKYYSKHYNYLYRRDKNIFGKAYNRVLANPWS